MDRILNALRQTDWAEIVEPKDFGLDPIYAVHDKDYVDFLASCWTEWLASEAEDKSTLLPATFALRRHPQKPTSLLGRAGYHMMDLSACIVEGTYAAALASANCASVRQQPWLLEPKRLLPYAVLPGITLARITQEDTASSITLPLPQTGCPQKERLRCSTSIITAVTERRISFTTEATC
jgi:acetoin utilization deacetylase AcuC-like enzyme